MALALNFLNRSYRMVLLAAGRSGGAFRNSAAAQAIKLAAMLTLVPTPDMAGAAAGAALGDQGAPKHYGGV